MGREGYLVKRERSKVKRGRGAKNRYGKKGEE